MAIIRFAFCFSSSSSSSSLCCLFFLLRLVLVLQWLVLFRRLICRGVILHFGDSSLQLAVP
jgi:hypothetical protein